MRSVRKYTTSDYHDGTTKTTTLMEVRVWDTASILNDKMHNVLTRLHHNAFLDGFEQPSFTVHDLKAAIRHQMPGYHHRTIYLYKAVYDDAKKDYIVDTEEDGPHDSKFKLDVLLEGDVFPHTWVILLEGHDYPKEITFSCYLEPTADYIKIPIGSTEVANAGKLKFLLQDHLWGASNLLAPKYLAQIQVHSVEGFAIPRPDRRLRTHDRLDFDPATKVGNKVFVRITDCEGRVVPKGHLSRTAEDPQTYLGATNGSYPFLYKTVDCGFEHPKVMDSDDLYEGYNAPTIAGVHYFNYQPLSTAAEAASRLLPRSALPDRVRT